MKEDFAKYEKEINDYSKDYRVLVLAHSKENFNSKNNLPNDIELIGYVFILDKIREKQESAKIRPGYYGVWAKCRNITVEEAIEKIKNGEKYIIRFKSPGREDRKIKHHDVIKGNVTFPENYGKEELNGKPAKFEVTIKEIKVKEYIKAISGR